MLLCRESNRKWTQITDHLDTVSVSGPASSAYIIIGDELQVLVNRTNKRNKTPKEVLKNIRVRMHSARFKRKKVTLTPEKLKALNHMGTKWSCPECQVELKTLYRFNKHLEFIRRHCCEYCFKILKAENFGQHLTEIHNLQSCQCEVCNLYFEDETSLARHRYVHNRGDFVCPECKQTFASMFCLTAHTNYAHGKIKCVCDELFTGHSCYNNHRKTCTYNVQTSQYVCDYCSKAFPQKGSLSHHIRNIHEEPNVADHQCHKCGKRFRNSATLLEHSNTHDKVLDRFTCKYCDKKYSTSRGYRKHLKMIHADIGPDLYKKLRCHTCRVCNRMLISETNLKNHMLRRHKD